MLGLGGNAGVLSAIALAQTPTMEILALKPFIDLKPKPQIPFA